MSKKVVLYSSSATGMLQTKKHIQSLKLILDNKKIKYEEVDCSTEPEKQQHMASISGKRVLPQVFVDDKFIGGWEEVEGLIETEEFDSVFK